MAAGTFTPYSTVSGYVAAYPGWIPLLEQERIGSYQTYEEIYWNHPETFKLVTRGTEDFPIYVPSGRVICDTMNRHLGTGLSFRTDPAPGVNAGTEQEAAALYLEEFLRREAFRGKFNSAKRFGVIRGDWLFHITADPLKLPGSRISIHAVDPASWFPVYDDEDQDKLIKVHLVEEYDLDGTIMIKKQTYERLDNGQIQSSLGIYEADKWFDPKVSPKQLIMKPTLLDPRITAFPIYAIPNFDQPGNPYGSSEMRGLERLMSAINQTLSDEDLALALEGLGVYATDGPGPVDEQGQPTPWILGPGRVAENSNGLKRINGVGSVQPYGDHLKSIWDFMKLASGTPDSAVGKVDVQIAESGVARLLDLGPILSKAAEKNLLIQDKLTQMMYDLRNWFAVHEGFNAENCRFVPTFSDPVPPNRKAEVDLAVALVEGKIMSGQTARKYLEKFGFEFDPNEEALIAAATASAAAAADPFGARSSEEADAQD